MSAAVEHMKRENKRAIDQARADEAEGHTCGAPHRSLRTVTERGLSNQEMLAEQQDEIATALTDLTREPPAPAKQTFRLGPLTMEGFDVRDIARIVVVLALIWMMLERHGVFDKKPSEGQPGTATAAEVE